MRATCQNPTSARRALDLRARLPKFEYAAPESLAEACRLLADPGARPLAGGTDLLVKLSRQLLAPTLVVSLRRVPNLEGITVAADGSIAIGACTRLADLAAHPEIGARLPAVAQAAGHTATVQIRNRATLGGNICNASPCADNIPTLMALGAQLAIVGPDGERTLPLGELFEGPSLTALARGELVTHIHVPQPAAGCAAAYERHSARSRVDLSAINVGVTVTLDGDTCTEARIVMGAVAATPLRANAAEAILSGEPFTAENVAAAARAAAEASKPITDVRATAEYRREMVAVLTARALRHAAERATKRGEA